VELIIGFLAVVAVIMVAVRPDLLEKMLGGQWSTSKGPKLDRLPPSHIASLCHLLGLLTILGGVLILMNESLVGFAVIAGSVFYFAAGSGLQYVFDIRNLLNERSKATEFSPEGSTNA
jgi:hypothetical protein